MEKGPDGEFGWIGRLYVHVALSSPGGEPDKSSLTMTFNIVAF